MSHVVLITTSDLRREGTFQRRQLCQNLFEIRSTLKGKNLLPVGANSFLLEKTYFRMWLFVQKSKQIVKKLSPCKIAENLPGISSSRVLS